MNPEKKVKKNLSSVLALKHLLIDVIQNPEKHIGNDKLITALRSQGTLSKYDDLTTGIFAISLNTAKQAAEEMLDGGFTELNRLRCSAAEAISSEKTKQTQPNRRSRDGLVLKIKELQTENLGLKEDLLVLTKIFSKSLTQARKYAYNANSDSLIELCKKEQRELLDYLSIRKNLSIVFSGEGHE